MMKSIDTYKAIGNITRTSLKYYVEAWRQSAFFIVLLCLIKALLTCWLALVNSLWTSIPIYVLVSLSGLVLLGAAFYRIGRMIEANPVSYQASVLRIKQRFVSLVVATAIIAIIVSIALYFSLEAMNHVAKGTSFLVMLFTAAFLGMLVIFILLYCFYVLPLILLTDLTAGAAFIHSAHYAKTEWKKTFVLYGFAIFIIYLVIPITRHSAWLSGHYLLNLFELVVLLLLLPLLMTMIIVSLQKMQEN